LARLLLANLSIAVHRKKIGIMSKLGKFFVAASIGLMAMSAQAVSVTCGDGVGSTRYLEVTTGALDGGLCEANDGNLKEIKTGSNPYVMGAGGILGADVIQLAAPSKQNNISSGIYSFDANYLADYVDLYFVVTVTGRGSPDWFIVELDGSTADVEWAFFSTSNGNPNVSISLYGLVDPAFVAPTPQPNNPLINPLIPTAGASPLPGSAPLTGLALGLLGLASFLRRNRPQR
jgi:hypothetical protein